MKHYDAREIRNSLSLLIRPGAVSRPVPTHHHHIFSNDDCCLLMPVGVFIISSRHFYIIPLHKPSAAPAASVHYSRSVATQQSTKMKKRNILLHTSRLTCPLNTHERKKDRETGRFFVCNLYLFSCFLLLLLLLVLSLNFVVCFFPGLTCGRCSSSSLVTEPQKTFAQNPRFHLAIRLD